MRPPGAPSQIGNTVYGANRTCKNLRASVPRGRNIVSRKSPLGWVNMSVYNFVVSGPKFTEF